MWKFVGVEWNEDFEIRYFLYKIVVGDEGVKLVVYWYILLDFVIILI